MKDKSVAILGALTLMGLIATSARAETPPGNGSGANQQFALPPSVPAAVEPPAAPPSGTNPQNAPQPNQPGASQPNYQPWRPTSQNYGAQTTAASAGQYAGALKSNTTGAYNPALVSGFNASNAAMMNANALLNEGFQNGTFDPNQFMDAKAAQMAAYMLGQGQGGIQPSQTSGSSGAQLKPSAINGGQAATNNNFLNNGNSPNNAPADVANNLQNQQADLSNSQAQVPQVIRKNLDLAPAVTEDASLGIPVNLVSVGSLPGRPENSFLPAQKQQNPTIAKKNSSPGQAFFDSLNRQLSAEQSANEEAKKEAAKSGQVNAQLDGVPASSPKLTLIDDPRRGDEIGVDGSSDESTSIKAYEDLKNSREPASSYSLLDYIADHYSRLRASLKELHAASVSREEYEQEISSLRRLTLFAIGSLFFVAVGFFVFWMRKQTAISEATADSRRLLDRQKLDVTAPLSDNSAKATELLPTKVREEINNSPPGEIIQFPHFDKAKQRWSVICLDQSKDAILAALPIAAGSVMKMSRFANLKDVNVVFGKDGGLRPTDAQEKVGLHVKGALARHLGNKLRFPAEKE